MRLPGRHEGCRRRRGHADDHTTLKSAPAEIDPNVEVRENNEVVLRAVALTEIHGRHPIRTYRATYAGDAVTTTFCSYVKPDGNEGSGHLPGAAAGHQDKPGRTGFEKNSAGKATFSYNFRLAA